MPLLFDLKKVTVWKSTQGIMKQFSLLPKPVINTRPILASGLDWIHVLGVKTLGSKLEN